MRATKQRATTTSLLACALLFASACGGAGDDSVPRSTPAPKPVSLPSIELDDKEVGALHGEVRYVGDAPTRFELGARKKPECCTHPEVDHMSDVVVATDGKLAGVFVTVTRGYDADDIPPAPSAPAHLDQRGCVYTPHVLGVQLGQALQISNSDPATHNVNAKAKKNDGPGNRNMGEGQAPLEVRFERPEASIRFKCDIHPWMEAWVHVEEHPWFAVSAADGSFRIPGLPPGTYTVEARHPTQGRLLARDLVVEAGRSTGFALTFEF